MGKGIKRENEDPQESTPGPPFFIPGYENRAFWPLRGSPLILLVGGEGGGGGGKGGFFSILFWQRVRCLD